MSKTKQQKIEVSKDKDGLKKLSYISTETELIPIAYLKELVSIIFTALEIFGSYLFNKKITNKNKS